MARIRTIKPEFFTDADLGELSPLHRLLFAGLWCEADREGRLVDRPRDLKVRILPFDRCDADKLLGDLAATGMIARYEADGDRFIAIRGFKKHQAVNIREPSSKLPEPPRNMHARAGMCMHVPERVEGKGREVEGNGRGMEGNGDLVAVLPASDFSLSEPPVTQPHPLQALWNELTAPPIPRWQGMGKARESMCQAALERRPIDGPGGWREVFRRIGLSAFCRGESADGWLANPDWALRPEGKKPEPASRVLEGAFDRPQLGRAGGARVDFRKGMVRADDIPKEAFAKVGTTNEL